MCSFFQHNMISAQLQWRQHCSWLVWDWCECAGCRCWFSTIHFRRNSTLLDECRFTRDDYLQFDPSGRTLHPNQRLALRKPLNPSCYSLFSLFVQLNCILCIVSTTVYFCPLLIFWCWWILMVHPCRLSTLLRILPQSTTWPWVASSIPCRHPAQTPTAWQPTCLPAWEPFGSPQRIAQFRSRSATAQGDQARNDSLGLNPTVYEEAEYVEADPISYSRENKKTRTNMSHFG